MASQYRPAFRQDLVDRLLANESVFRQVGQTGVPE